MRYITACFFATLLAASAANPFGVFDFNLRGTTPAEQIKSLDGIGYDGITLPLNNPKNLATLEAYKAAKPDLKLIAALFNVDHSKPEPINREHLKNVVKALANYQAKLWLIMGGSKGENEKVAALVREVADIAAAEKVAVSLYPHDKTAIESAEEALVILKLADRPNLTISFHQCHELRAGNIDRLDAAMAAVAPYVDLVSICGSDRKMNDSVKGNWDDAIKPLGEGDYDPKEFLRVLKKHNFKGPIILHTFGLMKKPASHYQTSYDLYQKMKSAVDAEPN
jgi:sugar phosphate isomerase/epimerase